MSGANDLTRDDDIDVAGIFASLKCKWWLVLLITLVTGALLVVALSLVSPRYESTARILIRDNDNTFTRATGDASSQQPRQQFDEQAIRSEVEVLSSDKLLLTVIKELNLAKLEEFDGDRNYLEVRNEVLQLTGQEDRIEKPRTTPEEVRDLNIALEIFKERLEVYAVERSQVIGIEYWSHNPELAQKIVDTLALRYVERNLSAKIAGSTNAEDLLDPEVKRLKDKAEEAENKVAEERARSNLLQSDNNNGLLATQQLSEVSRELTRLKTERNSAEANAETIRQALKNGSSIDVIPEVIGSPLVQRLREREVEIRARLSDLSTTLLPNHPRMKALNSQLRDFQNQIKTEARNIVRSLENNVQLTRQAEQALEREINELKQDAKSLDKKLVTLRSLEREADAANELFLEYQSRWLEAKTRSTLSQVDAEIISSATLADEAFFPKIIPFTIAGMVAAMLLSVLGVIAGSLLTAVGAHHDSNAKRQEPDIDAAVAIDDTSDSSADVDAVATSGNDEVAPPAKERNHFKELEAILHRSRGKSEEEQAPEQAETTGLDEANEPSLKPASDDGLKPHPVRFGAKVLSKLSTAVIPVVSPGGDIGSSTSWILARNLAKLNRSVVLLDMSGGEISSRKLLGKKGLPGLFNLLSGSVRADQILYKDKASPVNVVPPGSLFAGMPAPDNEMLQEVIEAIASPFDFCIIDCGDADISEVEMIAEDDAIVVISCIKATKSDVEGLEEDLADAGYAEVIRLAADKKDLAEKREKEQAA